MRSCPSWCGRTIVELISGGNYTCTVWVIPRYMHYLSSSLLQHVCIFVPPASYCDRITYTSVSRPIVTEIELDPLERYTYIFDYCIILTESVGHCHRGVCPPGFRSSVLDRRS